MIGQLLTFLQSNRKRTLRASNLPLLAAISRPYGSDTCFRAGTLTPQATSCCCGIICVYTYFHTQGTTAEVLLCCSPFLCWQLAEVARTPWLDPCVAGVILALKALSEGDWRLGKGALAGWADRALGAVSDTGAKILRLGSGDEVRNGCPVCVGAGVSIGHDNRTMFSIFRFRFECKRISPVARVGSCLYMNRKDSHVYSTGSLVSGCDKATLAPTFVRTLNVPLCSVRTSFFFCNRCAGWLLKWR